MSAYDDVFDAFAAANVRYVVVGGVAVVLRGHARMTVDLDLVVDLEGSAALDAVEALLGLGLAPRLPVDPRDFANPVKRRDWVENRHMQVFSFYDPRTALREIDLFADYPLPFDELLGHASVVDVNGRAVPVASVEHLIGMKEKVGRPQDLADVAALTSLRDGGAG